MKNKRGFLELSFAWIFALVVGGFILFLSIYIAIKFSGVGTSTQDIIVSKEIGILLNPLESGYEQAQTTKLLLQRKTRIENRCEKEEPFGRQVIGITEETYGKWSNNGSESGFLNKYIFSDKFVEGKEFYIFSEQFNFPFKIADVVILMSADRIYCFVDAPQEIQDKLSGLKLKNIFNKSSISQCPQGSEKVCFGGSCDIKVTRNVGSDFGKVSKKGKSMQYETEALMYAAIFSNNETYECQVKRLTLRAKQLASLYNQKAAFINRYGCNSNLQLASLMGMLNGYEDSRDLTPALAGIVNNIKIANEQNQVCRLW